MTRQTSSMFSADLAAEALRQSVVKLDPRYLVRNPVMFTTSVVALLVSRCSSSGRLATGEGDPVFEAQLIFWLWLTVLFGNFAEALAEGRGKAQAASLRSTKAELTGKRLKGDALRDCRRERAAGGGRGACGDRRPDPRGWRGGRGCRLGERGGDHGRKRPGDPRGRRRPLGGDRGHAGHLGPDQGPGHGGAR